MLDACSPFPVVASGFTASVRGMVNMDGRSFQLCHSKKSSVLTRAVLIKFYLRNVMDPCENTSIPEWPFCGCDGPSNTMLYFTIS
jgi:hypothetical protein